MATYRLMRMENSSSTILRPWGTPYHVLEAALKARTTFARRHGERVEIEKVGDEPLTDTEAEHGVRGIVIDDYKKYPW